MTIYSKEPIYGISRIDYDRQDKIIKEIADYYKCDRLKAYKIMNTPLQLLDFKEERASFTKKKDANTTLKIVPHTDSKNCDVVIEWNSNNPDIPNLCKTKTVEIGTNNIANAITWLINEVGLHKQKYFKNILEQNIRDLKAILLL